MVIPSTLSLLSKRRLLHHHIETVHDKIKCQNLHSSVGRTIAGVDVRRIVETQDGTVLKSNNNHRTIQTLSMTTIIPKIISCWTSLSHRYYNCTPFLESSRRHSSSIVAAHGNVSLHHKQPLMYFANNSLIISNARTFKTSLHREVSSLSRFPCLSGFSGLLPDRNQQFNDPRSTSSPIYAMLQKRDFAVKIGKKTIERDRKRQIVRAKKQGNYPTGSGHWVKKKKPVMSGEDGDNEPASLQHLEWVQFQRNIAVDGFETGQTTDVIDSRKMRGGSITRKKRERKLSIVENRLAERRRLTESGGGLFPPIRYSEEETEQLLNMAYAALPIRTGKRGTRNLKRQKRRWALVRKIRRTYKEHMAFFQERKMHKRADKMKQIKDIISKAPEARMADHEYQTTVLKKWWSQTHG